MAHHQYLIVGGGIAADAAARGIRSVDPKGSIGIVCDESDPPYDRPPLSKGLWNGLTEDKIYRGTADLDVHLHLGRKVLRIDRDRHGVTDDRGSIYSYDKLLIATGVTPRKLQVDVPQVIYFRTLADFRRLKATAGPGKTFAVVGGGFIGSEIASSLIQAGSKVIMLFPEDRVCAGVTTPEHGSVLTEMYREKGVDVRTGVTVETVRRSGPKLLVSIGGDTPQTLRVDGVVAGIGTRPNTMLAEGAGLEVENGIVVDASFRSSDPDVFAAGDVAAFWSIPLGRTLRIEHEDHANASGMLAGKAMAGKISTYEHIPFYYSTIFDDTYEVVGDVSGDMEVFEDWKVPHKKGVVYYMRGGRVRGVALWNVRRKLKVARELILSATSLFPFDEDAKIRIS